MRRKDPSIGRPQENQQRQKKNTSGKVFAMTKEDATASNAIVAGNISIASQCAYALFDPGATHSFISTEFAKKLDVLPNLLECDLSPRVARGHATFNGPRLGHMTLAEGHSTLGDFDQWPPSLDLAGRQRVWFFFN